MKNINESLNKIYESVRPDQEQVKNFFCNKKFVNIDSIRKNLEERGIKQVSYISGVPQAFYVRFEELPEETQKLINSWHRVIGSKKYNSNINKIIYSKFNFHIDTLYSLEQTYNKCILFDCDDDLVDKINKFKSLFESGNIDTLFSDEIKKLQYEVNEIILDSNKKINGVIMFDSPDYYDVLDFRLVEFIANDVFEVLSIIVKDIEKCELKLGKLYVRKTYDRTDSFYVKLDIDIENTLKKLHKLYSEAKYQIYKFNRIYNGDPNGRFYIDDKTVAVNNLIKSKFNCLIIGENEYIERFESEFNKLKPIDNQIKFELLSKFLKLESKVDNESFREIKELIYKSIYNLQ